MLRKPFISTAQAKRLASTSGSTNDQEEINVVQPQALQALLQRQLETGVVRRPRLGHDDDILSLDARRKRLLETLADLVLVAIAVGAVDEAVAALEGVGDGLLDLTGIGFPGAWLQKVSKH